MYYTLQIMSATNHILAERHTKTFPPRKIRYNNQIYIRSKHYHPGNTGAIIFYPKKQPTDWSDL